jgi:hypothetical protein
MIVEFGASKSPHATQPGSRKRCLFGDLRRGGSVAKEPNDGAKPSKSRRDRRKVVRCRCGIDWCARDGVSVVQQRSWR